MERRYFQPHDIPRLITVDLYLLYTVAGYSRGRLHVVDYWNEEDAAKPQRKSKYGSSLYQENILVSKFQVTIDIPEGFDPTKSYVAELKKEKRRLLAQHHLELKSIDDRIMSVLAIEHKPQVG